MPETSILRLRGAALLVCLSLLAACGGGGSDSPAPPASPTVGNVRITNVDQEVFQGNDPLQSLVVTADVTGDLSQLTGVYVLVEDPDALFASNAVLATTANGLNNVLTLNGRNSNNRVGSFRGPLRINVCSDSACRSPLRGSPLLVPYDIRVLQSLTVERSGGVTITGDFGTPAPAWTSGVTPPTGATSFRATLRDLSAATIPALTLSQSAGAITLTPGNSPVASNRYELTVTADGRTSKGRVVPFTSTQGVAYDVRSTGTPVIFSPAGLSFTIAARGTLTAYQRLDTLLANGEVADQVSTINFSGPGAVTGFWLLNRSVPTAGFGGAIEFAASACFLTALPPGFDPCLAPGVYNARVTLRTRGGSLVTREFDITLTVTP